MWINNFRGYIQATVYMPCRVQYAIVIIFFMNVKFISLMYAWRLHRINLQCLTHSIFERLRQRQHFIRPRCSGCIGWYWVNRIGTWLFGKTQKFTKKKTKHSKDKSLENVSARSSWMHIWVYWGYYHSLYRVSIVTPIDRIRTFRNFILL